MTDVLLISNSTENINIAWRHFCSRDYNASATVSYESAMDTLRKGKSQQIAVYYCGNDTDDFISFYRMLREDKKTVFVPLVVLADVRWIKALSEYVRLENACVLGITVGASKLAEVMRSASRGGLNKMPVQNRPSLQKPLNERNRG